MNFLILISILSLAKYGAPAYTDPIVSVLGFGNSWDVPADIANAPIKPRPYKLTGNALEHIQECFYHRVWERIYDADLSHFQAFCKRLSENNPNTFEKNEGQIRFQLFRQVWQDLSRNPGETNPAVLYKNYRLSSTEKREIGNCFFFRSWEHKETSKLSKHEDFCKRVSSNKPNAIDAREINSFKAYRKLWINMPKVARKDFSKIIRCSPLDSQSQSAKCKNYLESVKNPQTWREIRRKEVHDCMQPRKQVLKECQDTILFYKKKYCNITED